MTRMMTMTDIDDLAKTEIDPASLEAKPFVVIVGGWRPVGRYPTIEAAREKALTCVSALGEMVKMAVVADAS